MPSPIEVARATYRQAFVRDGHRCVYCNKDILETLDSFAASHLDHLKPKHSGGTDDILNCVIACAVCNSMKGGFNPSPDGPVTAETFDAVVAKARKYITDKREGTIPCTYYRDFQYWCQVAGGAG
jgi:5-methylcytosine-specific restriction endonuclease McrA